MCDALNSLWIKELRGRVHGSKRSQHQQKLELNMDPWFDRELFKQVSCLYSSPSLILFLFPWFWLPVVSRGPEAGDPPSAVLRGQQAA